MTALSILYVAASMVFVIGFIPQIATLLRDRTGAASINISSWAMFSGANLVTFMYALQANGDPYFIACSGFCMVGNLTVFGLASLRRAQVAIRVKA